MRNRPTIPHGMHETDESCPVFSLLMMVVQHSLNCGSITSAIWHIEAYVWEGEERELM